MRQKIASYRNLLQLSQKNNPAFLVQWSKIIHSQFSIQNFVLIALNALDTIGNCQRPVYSFGVSQHMQSITPLSHEVVCFQMLDFRPQILNLRSRNQIRGKVLLSRKLHYFRGSCFTMFYTINLPLPPLLFMIIFFFL